MCKTLNVWLVDDQPDTVDDLRQAFDDASEGDLTVVCEVIDSIEELFRRLGDRKRPHGLLVDVMWPACPDGATSAGVGLGLLWVLQEALRGRAVVAGLSVAADTYRRTASGAGIESLFSKMPGSVAEVVKTVVSGAQGFAQG
jgi:hypothetical protein